VEKRENSPVNDWKRRNS